MKKKTLAKYAYISLLASLPSGLNELAFLDLYVSFLSGVGNAGFSFEHRGIMNDLLEKDVGPFFHPTQLNPWMDQPISLYLWCAFYVVVG